MNFPFTFSEEKFSPNSRSTFLVLPLPLSLSLFFLFYSFHLYFPFSLLLLPPPLFIPSISTFLRYVLHKPTWNSGKKRLSDAKKKKTRIGQCRSNRYSCISLIILFVTADDEQLTHAFARDSRNPDPILSLCYKAARRVVPLRGIREKQRVALYVVHVVRAARRKLSSRSRMNEWIVASLAEQREKARENYTPDRSARSQFHRHRRVTSRFGFEYNRALCNTFWLSFFSFSLSHSVSAGDCDVKSVSKCIWVNF